MPFGIGYARRRACEQQGRSIVGKKSFHMRALIGFAVARIFWCLTPMPLGAQTVGGTILGVIEDQQGAAIGKAQVSARSLDTGAIRTATANESGAYRISSVPA